MAIQAYYLAISNTFAAGVAHALWRAAWQGALLILVVAAVCRIGRRLPAALRCWLWWLAAAKMLIALCSVAAIPLAVLPASSPLATRATAISRLAKAPLFSANAHWRLAAPIASKLAAGPRDPANPSPSQSTPATASVRRSKWPAPTPLQIGLIAWLLGVLFLLIRTAWAGLQAALVVKRADRASEEDASLARRVAEQMGLARAPRVVMSGDTEAVCVTGLFRPTIVLPKNRWKSLTPDEARMALAHEMAHIRRLDLWLGLAPAAARILFFFHPLVWLACAEYAASREEACDRRVLAHTGLPAGAYGRLLIKMAANGVAPAYAGGLSLSPTYRAMRRRLTVLADGVNLRIAPLARIFLAVAVIAIAVILVPWRLVAAERAGALSAAPATPSFALTDLGTAGPGDIAAVAMSEQGQVAATAQSADGNASYAFVLTRDSAYTLGSLPRYAYVRANAINDDGLVAASSYNLCDHNHAFVWRPDGHLRLAGAPGLSYTKALAINDSDQVAGYMESGKFFHGERVARAALWNGDKSHARALDLGTLGGPFSAALAINNLGDAVGKADTANPHETHAFLWRSGRMIDLGALPGGANSLASAVNNHGQVVGSSETADSTHAFLWQNGQMADLQTLPGAISSQANAINDQGEVVGTATFARGPHSVSRAVLWSSGRIYDLNNLVKLPAGWALQSACAVTSSGQIAGIGTFHGRPRVFVLTPTLPIPAPQDSLPRA